MASPSNQACIVDDVIMGCCDTIGSQAGDVARTAWLVAGLPDHVPGVTIDLIASERAVAEHGLTPGPGSTTCRCAVTTRSGC